MTYSNKAVWFSVIFLIVGLIVAGYYFNSSHIFTLSTRQAIENPMPSIASSTSKTLGIIYKKTDGVGQNGYPSYTFSLHDIDHNINSDIDESKAISWEGFNGKPIILYDTKSIANQKNLFDISAYDLTSNTIKRVQVSQDVDPGSSLAYSSLEKKVGYCSDEKEGTFYVEDMVTGNKTAYTSFSGCIGGNSFAPPQFSKDGQNIYYQEFGTATDDGQSLTEYHFRKLSLGDGVSVDVSSVFDPPYSQGDIALYPMITSFGNDVDTYNNQLLVYDISYAPRDLKIQNINITPIVFKKIFDPYVHLGSLLPTNDRSGFFFYTYAQKDNSNPGGDYKIGYFDNQTKGIIYPLGQVNQNITGMSLLQARDRNLLVFSIENKVTGLSDLYYVSAGEGKVTLVDSSVNLLPSPQDIFFVQSK